MDYYADCTLCPRNCGADRRVSLGRCMSSDVMKVARIAPHKWEEPCLSGKNGSGAVFFSGCSLGCVYCQNSRISKGYGKEITENELAHKMTELQNQGCHNINLVTGEHYVPSIVKTLDIAKANGLTVPVVYNSSGYENCETLSLLDGYVDIYLPDMKYSSPVLAEKYSFAKDYPEICKKALDAMYEQVGKFIINSDGIMTKGMIVRVLALPGCEKDTKDTLKYLKHRFGGRIITSLMSQYTPMSDLCGFDELSRKITSDEYDELCGYAKGLRIDNLYTQEGESASESFIPDFDEITF